VGETWRGLVVGQAVIIKRGELVGVDVAVWDSDGKAVANARGEGVPVPVPEGVLVGDGVADADAFSLPTRKSMPQAQGVYKTV
jgi:hypothetical protein